MKQFSRNRPKSRPTRPPHGFTLVEMLVATALVVLMMLLFAQVFQTSAGLISNQKGMAEHDQNVRTLTILLRGDISQRTFRDVIPFEPVTNPMTVVAADTRKSGFFSISENDPESGIDDVLHWTIKVDEGEVRSGSPQLPFSGKTTLIRFAEPSTMTVNPTDTNIDDATERLNYLLANRNQPEFDDGQLSVNGTGSSRYAEVCWFLRNGTLYRRMLLIREPYEGTSLQPQDSATPPNNLIPEDYTILNVPPLPQDPMNPSGPQWQDAAGRFWYDFDYSAFNDPVSNTPPGNGLSFHSAGLNGVSLVNENPPTTTLGSFPTIPPSLGIPCLRFGNSIRRALDAGNAGIPPREYLVGTDPTSYDPSTFIGRFTMQETAHSGFTYPSKDMPNGGGPFQDATALTLGADGLVTEFSDELGRRGEDIVMTNVHSFDIQVWDDAIRDFVNLGHSRRGVTGAPIGDYNANQRYRDANNPNRDFGNRYDTWHPNEGLNPPPYRPVVVDSVTMEETPKPLRGIRILIRFYDVGSDSMRDLTFTFPLID